MPIELSTAQEWECVDLGELEYGQAREQQERYLARRCAGEIADLFIACTHQPVVTLGKHCTLAPTERAAIEAARIPIVTTDRGGAATYHGPGQLVIYPVVHLPERGIGVRTFICSVLSNIAAAIVAHGLDCQPLIQPAGIWVSKLPQTSPKKIASVGMRINGGVTNHGFSINLTGDVSPNRLFAPCGLAGVSISTVESELPPVTLNVAELRASILERLSRLSFKPVRPPEKKRSGELVPSDFSDKRHKPNALNLGMLEGPSAASAEQGDSVFRIGS
jgi:lipoyl(octanoyl) transferase